MISYRRYGLYFTLSIIIFGLCIAGFNYVVNPYLMFNPPALLNIADKKPESDTRVRMFKKYQANFSQYSTLIVGNSRVEMGINPNSASFAEQAVYNLGIPGIGVNGQLAYAEHIMTKQAIDRVFISLDFLDFLALSNNTTYKAYTLDLKQTEERVASAFSVDATVSSIMTLLNQTKYAPTRLTNGFNPAQDYWPIIKYEGQAVLFEQKINQVQAGLRGKLWLPNIKYVAQSPLHQLIATIKKWQQKGCQVTVFINPYHSEYYQQIKIAGLSRAFKNWRELMRLTFETELSAPFYDFTDLGISKSELTDDNGYLTYFWEPAHYTQAMGELMLQRMIVKTPSE